MNAVSSFCACCIKGLLCLWCSLSLQHRSKLASDSWHFRQTDILLWFIQDGRIKKCVFRTTPHQTGEIKGFADPNWPTFHLTEVWNIWCGSQNMSGPWILRLSRSWTDRLYGCWSFWAWKHKSFLLVKAEHYPSLRAHLLQHWRKWNTPLKLIKWCKTKKNKNVKRRKTRCINCFMIVVLLSSAYAAQPRSHTDTYMFTWGTGRLDLS